MGTITYNAPNTNNKHRLYAKGAAEYIIK